MKLAARERKLLAGLAILAGIAAVRAIFVLAAPAPLPPAARPVVATAERSSFARGSSRRTAQALPQEMTELRIAELQSPTGALSVGRDPFRYGPFPAPPPPPPPTRAELAERARLAEEARLAREAAAREALIPRPPPVTLVYLGSFGSERRRIAVFADAAGENLYNVRVGDTVEGKFIVDRIGYESVDLKFVGFPDEPAKRLAIGG
ncbi:MAG: hypothetical protein ABI639_12910 [Thermoanaerobaculia bacterium]